MCPSPRRPHGASSAGSAGAIRSWGEGMGGGRRGPLPLNEEALQEPPGEIAEHHVPVPATASPRFERRLRRRNPVMGGGHGRGPSRPPPTQRGGSARAAGRDS